MSTKASDLSLLDLSSEDLAALPAPLRDKIAAQFGPADKLSGEWLLVGARQHWMASIIERAVDVLHRSAAARRAEITEAHIESLVEVLLDGAPRSKVELDLEADNAQLRAAYLRGTKTLTAAEVRKFSGLAPKNKSEPASRWKREGKVFAVRHKGADHFPAFQFVDGAPIPALREILAALPGDLTPWQTAFWFASGNGWLDGAAPQDMLADPDRVVTAARRLSEPAVG